MLIVINKRKLKLNWNMKCVEKNNMLESKLKEMLIKTDNQYLASLIHGTRSRYYTSLYAANFHVLPIKALMGHKLNHSARRTLTTTT